MASARQDFEHFVAWVHRPEQRASANVRRFANLVLERFDDVADKARQHNNRSIYLAALARQRLVMTSDQPPAIDVAADGDAWPWRRLQRLTLGPFRGFRTPESFDLRKRVVLFIGPNGSGKTSLCEGLEYALLGAVEEAGTKRIETATYLANVHERRFVAPELIAMADRDRQIAVAANADVYRFCFIEQNRIDAFSRIAARPTTRRAELIATLFGMDKFNDFVGHFNDSMDGQLVTKNERQRELATRRAALATDKAAVVGAEQDTAALTEEEAALARTHSADSTYAAIKALVGTADAPGRLQELEAIVNAVPPVILAVTREGFIERYEATCEWHRQLLEVDTALAARASEVSFKELYTAVLALQPFEGHHCPACETPLIGEAHVVSDPYARAAAGLDRLQELGQLQARRDEARAKLRTSSAELHRQLSVLTDFLAARGEDQTAACRFLSALAPFPEGAWWVSLFGPWAGAEGPVGLELLEQVLGAAERVGAQDIEATAARQERQRNIQEKDQLNALRLRIQAQNTKRKHFVDGIAAASARIAAFDVANAGLIAAASQELADMERDAPIKVAYDAFLSLVRSYCDRLPGTLMAGLNDLAMELYNSFNREDLDADKLASLHLPITGEQKIEVCFRGDPRVRVDALRILSEGHIRCLGLAILLAKNKSLRSPLIVFDDAVNAIDHDHRAGIRTTIFESDDFAEAQLIVTCHSGEFIKDIQQHLPARHRGDCQVYALFNHDGNHQPRVRGDLSSRNYVIKARAGRGALDDREALASARRAFEVLAEKVWRWLGSHGHGLLSLQLPGVRGEPSLRNLCEGIHRKLVGADTFAHGNKQVLVEAFGRVLGIPVVSMEWSYLNSGTHEEANRDDFDANVVESLIATLEVIDALDLRDGR